MPATTPHTPQPARRRILFLTPQLPYPPEQGAALRNYSLICQVAQHHAVSLLTFAPDSQGPASSSPLQELCQIVRTVPPPERTSGDRLRTLALTRLPDMARRLQSAPFTQALRDLVTREPFDVIQVEGIEMAPYGTLVRQWLGERFPAKTEAGREQGAESRSPALVFDDHNAEYVLQQRACLADARRPARWPAALYSLVQWRRLARFERRFCRDADVVVAVSEADARALQRLDPSLDPLVVPNGVDTGRYHPDLPDTLPLRHPAVVFTGKMDYRPNVDAMLWFHRRVWPRVLAAITDAHLYIVGKSPHPRLAPLRGDPSVTITGWVPDVLPYLAGADVVVAPMRTGGGTQLKVLEAMAAGRPLVTTTFGAEGVGLTPGQHALVEDDPARQAQAIGRLLADRAAARALATAGRRLVVERYDWSVVAARLEDVYASL